MWGRASGLGKCSASPGVASMRCWAAACMCGSRARALVIRGHEVGLPLLEGAAAGSLLASAGPGVPSGGGALATHHCAAKAGFPMRAGSR